MSPMEEIAGFADIPIEIRAQLDRRTMLVRDVLSLEAGQVIPLSRAAGENADILAGGTAFAFGEAVVIENRMAVRITDFVVEE